MNRRDVLIQQWVVREYQMTSAEEAITQISLLPEKR
jgi:hypothetical protein